MDIKGFLFIFIKDNNELSPSQIIEALNIHTINPSIEENGILEELQFIRKNNWIYLIDHGWHLYVFLDYLYSGLSRIGKKYELFFCTAGDVDTSYDFKYYNNKELVRDFSFQFENHSDGEGKIVSDYGTPFLVEEELDNINEPFDKIFALMKSFSFDLEIEDIDSIPFTYKGIEYQYKNPYS